MIPLLPAPIPDDPRFPGRPTHTVQVLGALARSGFDFTKVQVAQSLLLAPLNLKFCLPVLGNLKRLHKNHPDAFSHLKDFHADALQKTIESNDLLLQISDPKLMVELRKSPRDSVTGNLNYSTSRHPLYSLLMLEHPYATSPYFDLLVAFTIGKSIGLRVDFQWEHYRQYIHPDGRLTALCPQQLNSAIARIEFLGRAVTGNKSSDPFARLAEKSVPLEITSILNFYKEEAKLNRHSKSAVKFAAKIESFLEATSSRGGGGRGGDRDVRNGLNIGTLLAGDLAITASEFDGASIVSCINSHAEQKAADLDMAPEEVTAGVPTLLLELGIGASLPTSARIALSRHIANQVAKSQQLMVTRDSGLRPHRLQPVRALLTNTNLSPKVSLLLRASLATGRPISVLEKMVITTGASVEDADEAIELDTVRKTWRIKVNSPSLRKKDPPARARATSSHAELPDVVGATTFAIAYRTSKSLEAERVVLRWTPDDQEQAKALLKSIKLDAEYLGRVLPMALYESSGDLATGALISRWLPNSSETYLHYLSVNRKRIAEKYWEAAQSLRPMLSLPMPDVMPMIETGFVGMHNCPDDGSIRQLVAELLVELESHPTATTADRASYINLLSTYTVLYLTQGLGLRNSIDPDPEVQSMSAAAGGLGLAIFSDKLITDSHIRVLYCPSGLTEHMAGLENFSTRIQQEFPTAGGKEAPGLLPFVDEDGRVRRYHPKDVAQVLGERFNFMPNALRRRARSRMYDYRGCDAAALGHGFSAWMGHWSAANNPHRPESGGLREALRGVATKIIGPLLNEDGWRPVPPRV